MELPLLEELEISLCDNVSDSTVYKVGDSTVYKVVGKVCPQLKHFSLRKPYFNNSGVW